MLLPKLHHITLKNVHCLIYEYKKKHGGQVPSYVIVSIETHYYLKRELYAANNYSMNDFVMQLQSVPIISSADMLDNQIEVVKAAFEDVVFEIV
jgi:hypothetical protein